MNILESASKIVFVLMALALIGLTFMGIVDSQDFMTAALMTFTFFFSYKSDNKENKPYNGK